MSSPNEQARPFLAGLNPISEPTRSLKVICIGAGASGLLVAYKLQRNFDDFKLNVYEKNADVSGTWFENIYPGCACDVPAHCYTWSFEPNPDWSASYASSREIHNYFKGFSEKYGLNKYIRLQHQVVNAIWHADEGMWEVDVKHLATGRIIKDSAHVVINAAGILNSWRFPPIPGINDYRGTLLHSAGWDPKVDLKGKTVGLIGNGSSGIQILPAIKDHVKDLVTFIREPTWISPPVGQKYEVYSEEEKRKFASDPSYHLEMRRETEKGMNGQFKTFHAGSKEQQHAREFMLGQMKQKLKNPALEHLLIPDWSVGCRRITPGPDYLESLTAPNVKVVYGEISHITSQGCVVDGQEYPTDILICATGFDTTFKPRFPLIGNSGEALSEVWKDEPNAYLGIATNNYPNYFMLLGPNCPIGNGPVLISIEAEVDYIVKMLSKFQKESLKSFDVKADAVRDFNEWKNYFMKGTVWSEQCRSWYKAGSAHGNIAALWPGSTLHYLETLSSPRWEDWKFESAFQNRFAYLGNGLSSAESRGGDLAYYIRNADDSTTDLSLKKPVRADLQSGQHSESEKQQGRPSHL